MKYVAENLSLAFASQAELEEFHHRLSILIRGAMVATTREIQDPARAKRASREVLKEFRTVVRALNAIRQELPRKQF